MSGKKTYKKEARFRKLVDKYRRGKASEQEIRFLDMYYREFESRPDILNELQAQEVNEIGNRIKNKIAAGVSATEQKQSRVIGIGSNWMKAAIIIGFLLTGILGYFFIRQSDSADPVAENYTNQDMPDMPPGGNKAILTLADGSQIVLDSADNGLLAKQGSSAVVKLGNGELAYNPDIDRNSTRNAYNTISTPRGGMFRVVLSDGTKVWLNAASSLTFPASFTGAVREVTMTGEGYFEVAPDAAKPFIVKKGETEIRVLGTHFNIKAYDDEEKIQVTLLEGAVEVSDEQASLRINPGEQAAVHKGTIALRKTVNLDEVMAWKNGKFYFEKASIKDVMRQISRWYDLDVEYKGSVSEYFGGTISKNVDASRVFEMLEFTGDVHFKIEEKKVTVMP